MWSLLLGGGAVFCFLLGAGWPARGAAMAVGLLFVPWAVWHLAAARAAAAGVAAWDLFLRYAVMVAFLTWGLYQAGKGPGPAEPPPR